MKALIRCWWQRWLGLFAQPVRPQRTHARLVLEGLETRETPSISATVSSLSLVEGTAASPVVATFTDTQATSVTSSMKALITWGDNTSSNGTITHQAGNAHGFSVTGTKTYSAFGTYPLSVQIMDGKDSVKVQGTVKVADAPLTASPVAIGAVQGTPFSGVVATFTDADPKAKASLYSATITWGDNQTSQGTITSNGKGGFNVTGSHTFASGGGYPASVKINDIGGSTVTVSNMAIVASTPITITPKTIITSAGGTFHGVVASFTDAQRGTHAGQYTATIDWGDGSTSLGTITANAKAGFDVSGSHTYGQAGSYSITVQVSSAVGIQATLLKTFSKLPNFSAPVTVNGKTFFTVETFDPTNPMLGSDGSLYVSDGTPAGTVLLKDFGIGAFSPLTVSNGKVYFASTGLVKGMPTTRFYVTDGTVAGTTSLLSLAGGLEVNLLTSVNGRLFFTALTVQAGATMLDAKLYTSNGTSSGTVLLKDLGTFSAGTMPVDLTGIQWNGRFYLNLIRTTNLEMPASSLYVSDGTAAGTSLLKNFGSNTETSDWQLTGGKLYFTLQTTSNGAPDARLYVSYGTAAGTSVVKDFGPGSQITGLDDLNGKVVFAVETQNNNHSDFSVYSSDGTAAGTTLVKDLGALSFPSPSINPGAATLLSVNETKVNGNIYFAAPTSANPTTPSGLYMISSQGLTVSLVADYGSGTTIDNLINSNGMLYFTVQTANAGPFSLPDLQLYASNGTPGGTLQVQDLGTSSSLQFLLAANGTVFYLTLPAVPGLQISAQLYALTGTNGGLAVMTAQTTSKAKVTVAISS